MIKTMIKRNESTTTTKPLLQMSGCVLEASRMASVMTKPNNTDPFLTVLLNGVSSNLEPVNNNGTTSLPDEVPEFTGIVTAETLKRTAMVVNGCILPVIVLCGVTMNVINMAVFCRQGLRDRVNLCLFSLALSDSGFNLFHFAARNSLLYFFDDRLAEYWD
ncbi:hypothetical protein BaRGS_00032124, partial [Batillaria attramentaria]